MPLNKEVYDKNDFETFVKFRSQRVLEFRDKQLVEAVKAIDPIEKISAVMVTQTVEEIGIQGSN